MKLFRASLRSTGLAEDGWIGVEGPRLAEGALGSGLEIEAILVSVTGERHLAEIRERLTSSSSSGHSLPRILRTTDRLFAAISGTETPQGIAALVKPRSWTFDDLLKGGVALIVVLAGVQDPGNVGTILRSAEAFGATGAVATRGTAHPWSPKVLRASAGSALRLPILPGMAIAVVLAQLRVSGLKIYAASASPAPQARASLPGDVDFLTPAAIVIGNEAAGLPQEVARSTDASVLIPIAPGVDSLNAAVAASVLLYEAARQRSRRS